MQFMIFSLFHVIIEGGDEDTDSKRSKTEFLTV